MRKAAIVCLLVVALGLSGCAFLFGEAVPVLDENGVALLNDDGTPVLRYEDGVIGKAARIIAPVADAVPYGSAGTGVLALIAGIGAMIQTARARGRVAATDVVKLVDDAGKNLGRIQADQDLGDLVGRLTKDKPMGKVLKAAFDKVRKAEK